MRIRKGKQISFCWINYHEQQAEVSAHQLEGAIPAFSVVEVEEKYKKLAEHLFRKCFYC
ncbi:MAG: hypothetical protein V9F01_13245 [Chitinophagaceae bacterium]